ncbi:PIN domain-containing protein [Breznakiellaceae bacterium SP9]
MNYVFDACALISVFNNEQGSDTVRELLSQSLIGTVSVFISPVNLTEVFYDCLVVLGPERTAEIYGWIKTLITVPETISDSIIFEAGRLKSLYKIALGDAFGLATAVDVNGTFVSSDHHELEKVAQHEHIPFLWFR